MGADRPAAEIKLASLSIEFCETAGPCVQCGEVVSWGLVGFTLGDPDGRVCDGCLLALNKDLGMLLIMAHVVRELATQAVGIEDPWQADQLMVTLMMFAKIYDQGASWPRRPIAAKEFVEGLSQRVAGVPVAAVAKTVTKMTGEEN